MRKNNLKILFKPDIRIFSLFAMLNYAGYNDENNKNGFHPVRRAIRKLLSQKNEETVKKEISHYTNKFSISFLIRIILYLKADDFQHFSNYFKSQFISRDELNNFLNLFAQFYKEKNISKLWQKYQPPHQEIIIKHKNQIVREFRKLEQLLPILFKKVVLIPNLLDAYWRGYGPTLNETHFIIFGPLGHKSGLQLFRHEFLHGFFSPYNQNPLIKNLWRETSKIVKEKKYLTKIGDKSEMTIIGEYLVRAAELIYKKYFLKLNIEKYLKKEKDCGFEEIDRVINRLLPIFRTFIK